MRTQMNDMLSTELLKAGFKPFSDKGRHPLSNCAFQKTIYGPKGDNLSGMILYYINVVQWRFTDTDKISYQADVTFFREVGNKPVSRFKVELTIEDSDNAESIEAFFADMYRTNYCIPDMDNN